jgi:tyrosine decarboxylase/aspartate 1-decarboxylase
MLEDGLTKQEILKLLEKKLSKDFTYDSGSILGSMCTDPLEFGQYIYLKYLGKNLGDPGLFPGTAELEKELLSEISELFSGSSNITGTFTSGGSEANIIAMRVLEIQR